MPEFAVVQQAIPTSVTTVDFTSSGFGTPKGAIFFWSKGVTNGTAVNSAMLGIGWTDGTQILNVGMASEDNVTANTGDFASGNPSTRGPVGIYDTVTTNIGLDNSTNGGIAKFSAWITDGVRLSVTDAPAEANLVTCVLIGGTGVTNVQVEDLSTPSTVDTATDITTPGFNPDLVIVAARNGSAINSTRQTTSGSLSIGICVNDGTNPPPQYCIGHYDLDAANPSQILAASSTNRALKKVDLATSVELRDFDSSGFSAFLRNVTGTAQTFGYIALKFSGITAKLVQSDSPTATGSHSITGAGFIPQFGLMVHSSLTAWDTQPTDDTAETFGISAFTDAAQYCCGISEDDNVATANTESLTDSKPVALRKDGAAFQTATFTAFTSDGATFNYSATDGTARKRIALFVSASASSITGAVGSGTLTGVAGRMDSGLLTRTTIRGQN